MTEKVKSAPAGPRRAWLGLALVVLVLGIGAAVWFGRGGTSVQVAVPVPESMDDLREALQELIQKHVDAVRAAPEDAIAHATLGLVYEANGLWTEARDCYATAARLAPDEPMWLHHHAVALKMWGDPEASLNRLREGVSKFPTFAPMQWAYGDALSEVGSVEEAGRAFEAAIEGAPEKCEGYVGLGDVKLRQGEHAEAAALLEKAVELDPYYKSARYSLGLAYRGLGRRTEAEEQLLLGTAAKKRSMEDAWGEKRAEFNLTVSGMMAQSDQLMNAGRIDEAIKLLRMALTLSPDDPAIFNQMAAAFLMGGRFPQAEEVLLRAEQLEKDHLGIQINLAACYLGMKRPDRALVAADRAVELDPDTWEAPFNRGLALSRLQRHEEAYVALTATLKLDPPGANAHIALGDVCLAMDRNDEAMALYSKAVERAPESPLAQYGMCRSSLRLERWEEARVALDALRALVPNDPVIPVLEERLPDSSREDG